MAANSGARATNMANRAADNAQNSANAVQQQTTQELNREQADLGVSAGASARTPKP